MWWVIFVLLGASAQQFSGSDTHGCWVIVDSLGYCAGSNAQGELANPNVISSLTPLLVERIPPLSDVKTGYQSTCFLTQEGDVWCSGLNSLAQMGQGSTVPDSYHELVLFASDVEKLGLGGVANCVIHTNSTLVCVGGNLQGQLGTGSTATVLNKRVIAEDVLYVSNGEQHMCYVYQNGTLRCAGSNQYGQVGSGSPLNNRLGFETALTDGTSVQCGGYHTCALVQGGGVRCWGWNALGQLGDTSTTQRVTPVSPLGLESVTGISTLVVGHSHTLVLYSNGTVQGWGYNNRGQLVSGSTEDYLISPILSFSGIDLEAVGVGPYATCGVTVNGDVLCVGRSLLGALGVGVNGNVQNLTRVEFPSVTPTASPTESPSVQTHGPTSSPTRFPTASPTVHRVGTDPSSIAFIGAVVTGVMSGIFLLVIMISL